MKFKLVKSNSCSSRLELAGTGLLNETKMDGEVTERLKNIIHRTPSPVIDAVESEETVRDKVYKLEHNKVNTPSMPRIIESRCIEKIYNEKNTENLKKNFEQTEKEKLLRHEDDYVMINNQTIEYVEPDDKSGKPGSEATKVVTVNNHITITAQSNKQDNNHSSGILQNTTKSAKTKVVRNKNVDLALAAMANKNLNNKPIKDKENLARKASSSADLSSLKKSLSRDSLNEMVDRKSDPPKMTKWDSIGKLETSDKNHSVENGTQSKNSNPTELPSAMKSPNSASNKTTKMVNWSTVGKLDKEFSINDKRLIQTKKYDEMEFEEFEVMGEHHYDSLNSNK